MGRNTSERFAALDLLRGVAALAVLTLHLPWPTGVRLPFPKAYLAVDLFFVLSGFVIAHAYEHRLTSDTQFKQFCVARIIRLYPLYLMATLMAGAMVLAAALFGAGSHPFVTVRRSLASFAIALLMLPTPRRWSTDPTSFFPLVFPAWSLMWELWVNLLYGFITVRFSRKFVALCLGAGLVGLVLALRIYGDLSGGWEWRGAWSGGARALFSFFLGVIVFRLRRRCSSPSLPGALLPMVLLAALVPAAGGSAYEIACVGLLFPILVWLGADAVMSPMMRLVADFSAYISYPVYLLQAPLLLIVGTAWLRFERVVPQIDTARVFAYAFAVIVGSWLVARYCDSPLRDFLRLRFASQEAEPQAETAP